MKQADTFVSNSCITLQLEHPIELTDLATALRCSELSLGPLLLNVIKYQLITS